MIEGLPAQQYILSNAHDDESEDVEESLDVGHDDGEPEQPIVVAEMSTQIMNLTVSEAVMHMDLANIPALMFKNSAHGGLNMIYRREDGNIGWIDPRGNAES